MKDLLNEMMAEKRKFVGQPESDWAIEYGQSLIPKWVRYPQKGDVYEALHDQQISYATGWSAPFTGGKATLFQGERVMIDDEPSREKPVIKITMIMLGKISPITILRKTERRIVACGV